MKLGTKGLDTNTKQGESKWLDMGNQRLKIYSHEIKNAGTGSKQVIMHMEGNPITTAGFEPESGHQGKVGKVALPGVYIKMEEKSIENLAFIFGVIADKLEVRSALDGINVDIDLNDKEKASTQLDNYINSVMTLFYNKWAWWTIAGERYYKATGNGVFKPGTRLKIARYQFIASEKEGEQHLKVFDKSDSNFFRDQPNPTGATSNGAATPVTNDLPF